MIHYDRIAQLLRQLADEFSKLNNMHPTIRIEDLELSIRTRNVLENDKITTLDDLLNRTRQNLKGLPHCGAKTLKEIDAVLANLNVSLRKEDT